MRVSALLLLDNNNKSSSSPNGGFQQHGVGVVEKSDYQVVIIIGPALIPLKNRSI